jgi:hypothetical protein
MKNRYVRLAHYREAHRVTKQITKTEAINRILHVFKIDRFEHIEELYIRVSINGRIYVVTYDDKFSVEECVEERSLLAKGTIHSKKIEEILNDQGFEKAIEPAIGVDKMWVAFPRSKPPEPWETLTFELWSGHRRYKFVSVTSVTDEFEVRPRLIAPIVKTLIRATYRVQLRDPVDLEKVRNELYQLLKKLGPSID